MTKFVRILGKVKTKPGKYSERFDKVRIVDEDSPLNGVVLQGHIRHVKNKLVGDHDLTIIPIFNEKGILVKKIGCKGINVDFLIANQPAKV